MDPVLTDDFEGVDNYDDSRMELRAMGHNLVMSTFTECLVVCFLIFHSLLFFYRPLFS